LHSTRDPSDLKVLRMTPFLRKRDVASNVSTITRLAIDLNYLCLTCTARQILGLLRRAQDFDSGLGRTLNASTSDLKVLRLTPCVKTWETLKLETCET